MDEIFDRIKANIRSSKIKHKHLVASLIATEIFGILVFIWILKTPLYEKFLTFPPKAYSVTQLDNQKNYLMAQGDFLTGQINPTNTLALLIWENNQVQLRTKLKPETSGNWNYQLPIDLKPGVKIITLGELDSNNNTWLVNNYRIRVKSRHLIDFSMQQNQHTLFESTLSTQEEVSKTAFDLSINQIYSQPLKAEASQPQEY